MDVVFSAADRIAVLHQGRVIAEGAPEDDPRQRRSAPRLSRRAAIECRVSKSTRSARTTGCRARSSACRSRWSAASACACSAATASASPRSCARSWASIRPRRGGCVWKGDAIQGWRRRPVARAGIGFVPEDRRVFADLTVVRRTSRSRCSAARRAGTLDGGGGMAALPQARHAARAARGVPVGRRAADADHRADADVQSRAPAARRAVGRIGARWSSRASSSRCAG